MHIAFPAVSPCRYSLAQIYGKYPSWLISCVYLCWVINFGYHLELISAMDAISPYPFRNSDQLAVLLRNLRMSRRMTQRDLAERLGLSQPRIAEIERRPGRITVDQLLAVMHALGATVLITSGRVVDLSGQATVRVTGEVASPSTRKDGSTPKGEW